MGTYVNPGTKNMEIDIDDEFYVDKSLLVKVLNTKLNKKDRLLTSSKEINLLNQLKDVISLVKAVVEYLFVALVVRAIQVVQVVALMVVLLDAALDVNIKVAQTVVHKDVLV